MEKATEAYQKTVEKTSSLFSKVKENPAVNSLTERIGGVYTAARSKLPGGAGGDVEDAFKEGGAGAPPPQQNSEMGEQPVTDQPPAQQQMA